jgi:double zinc ribbon protein
MSDLTDAIAQTFGDVLGLPAVGLAGRLLLLGLAVLWLAAAWWTWRDAQLRTGDPLLRAVATAGIVLATPVFFPLALVVYMLLRPPLPEDPSRILELRLTELAVGADPDRCPHCSARIAQGWQRCPACGQVLSTACPSCGEAVGMDWLLCAWCAAELPWAAEPADIRPIAPPVAIPIVPGGRPLVPVMAVPENDDRGRELVGAAAMARARRHERRLAAHPEPAHVELPHRDLAHRPPPRRYRP